MPIILSAKKKLRADARKESNNRKVKAQLRFILKKFAASPTNEALRDAFSILDVAAKKRIIPKGRADRKKSRLTSLLSKKVIIKTGKPDRKVAKKQRKTKTT